MKYLLLLIATAFPTFAEELLSKENIPDSSMVLTFCESITEENCPSLNIPLESLNDHKLFSHRTDTGRLFDSTLLCNSENFLCNDYVTHSQSVFSLKQTDTGVIKIFLEVDGYTEYVNFKSGGIDVILPKNRNTFTQEFAFNASELPHVLINDERHYYTVDIIKGDTNVQK